MIGRGLRTVEDAGPYGLIAENSLIRHLRRHLPLLGEGLVCDSSVVCAPIRGWSLIADEQWPPLQCVRLFLMRRGLREDSILPYGFAVIFNGSALSL